MMVSEFSLLDILALQPTLRRYHSPSDPSDVNAICVSRCDNIIEKKSHWKAAVPVFTSLPKIIHTQAHWLDCFMSRFWWNLDSVLVLIPISLGLDGSGDVFIILVLLDLGGASWGSWCKHVSPTSEAACSR